MLVGAFSGILYFINTLVSFLPFTVSLFVVPGTTFVLPDDNLSANGCPSNSLTLK